MKKYDGLYIFTGLNKDDMLEKQLDKACGEITRLSGVVLNTEVLGKKHFARTMQKQDSGTYAKIRFELDPTQVKTLLHRYQLSGEVFRVQILAVDEKREVALQRQKDVHQARAAARQAAAEAKAEALAEAESASESEQ